MKEIAYVNNILDSMKPENPLFDVLSNYLEVLKAYKNQKDALFSLAEDPSLENVEKYTNSSIHLCSVLSSKV